MKPCHGTPRVLVIAGGVSPTAATMRRVGPTDAVIVADSGLDHARHLDIVPSLAVGDFDSVSPEGLAWATEHGVALQRHRVDKDQSDLALALEQAAALGPSEVVVAGIDGGRPDHFVTNLAVLGRLAQTTNISVSAESHDARYWWVTADRVIDPHPCSTVTLTAVGGDATGVITSGFRYRLAGETLEALSSRGLSNVVTDDVVSVCVESGIVLAIGTIDGAEAPGVAR